MGAGVYYIGQKAQKGLSEGVAKGMKDVVSGIQFPSISMPNITMPSITMPNITMPNINLTMPNIDLSAIIPSLGQSQPQSKEIYNVNGTSIRSVPVTVESKPIDQSSGSYLPPITDILKSGGLFGGLSQPPKTNIQTPSTPIPTKSTAQGGTGIWIPDNKVSGGGYFIQDNLSDYAKQFVGGTENSNYKELAKQFQQNSTPSSPIPSEPPRGNSGDAAKDKAAMDAWAKQNSAAALGGWYQDEATHTWRQR